MEPKDTLAERQGRKQAEATRLPPIGFWSYARQDDQLSSGRLTALRSLLIQELQQQYGREPVRLFQDMDTIPHGSDWETEIKKAIDASTFFIPIITPNFVQSEWCCREVELFIGREKALRVQHPELAGSSRVFPILFIAIDDADPEDPAVLAALQKLQWFDFRRFRHRSFDDPEIREALSEFAGAMRSLLKTRLGPAASPSERGRERIAGAIPADEVGAAAASTSPTEIVGPTSPAPAREAASQRVSERRPPKPIEVGDLLNHMFEVKRFIKAGGMGQVFEGSNAVTGERVAIKALLPALAADPKITEMFQREAMTLTRLSHEALVQYRAMAKEPELGVLYIVTEYVDGVDLGEALDQIDCDSGELKRLLARLASGLAAAHRLGAIHRDISLDNIMLPGGDIRQAKIIDFGIAKDLGGALPTLIGDGFAGKLSFVAPEQLGDHEGRIGSWTDVYSLALVILAVAKGEKVDMAGSFADAIRKRREVPDLSAAPSSLRSLLADMLRPDPAERLQTMDEVIARLAEAKGSAQREQVTPPRTRQKRPAPEAEADADATIVHSLAAAPAQVRSPQTRPMPWLWLGLGMVALVALVAVISSLSRDEERLAEAVSANASATVPAFPVQVPSRPPDRSDQRLAEAASANGPATVPAFPVQAPSHPPDRSDQGQPIQRGRSARAAGLSGAWEGQVTQYDPSGTYPMAMNLDGNVGNINYPTLGCGGNLEFIRTDGTSFWYREHITFGVGRCTDGGTIRMRRRALGANTDWDWDWDWDWYQPGGRANGSSVVRGRGVVEH